ncbi:hypothetical protein G2W53_010075 [Senna tora]|uniref:Reverse transcriptase zinc-binding domain-containing protein n=1 Tax=Senna tora TaxID=362788 RepID=A0A835CAY1_9FABA|nr:hypothetical protein G2W53_010075 [Senna tora]
MWHGVCKVRKELEKGIKWKIGNGKSVKFRKNFWVQDLSALSSFAICDIPELMVDCRVFDFCINGDWNVDKLRFWLPDKVVNMIVALCPPLEDERDDSVCWRWDNSGDFSVKLAFMAGNKTEDDDWSLLWKAIWRGKGPPRVKTFLWLMGKDRLLANWARFRRKMSSDLLCPRCKMHSESVLHAVRDCKRVKDLWLMLVDPSKWGDFFSSNLNDWILSNMKFAFGGEGLNWKIVFGVVPAAREFYSINDTFDFGDCNKLNGRTEILVRWQSPNEDWVKLNVDGSSFILNRVPSTSVASTPYELWTKRKPDLSILRPWGSAAYIHDNSHKYGKLGPRGKKCIFIRDALGSWLWSMAKNIGSCSSLEAELWGVLSGLEIAWEKDFKKILVEVDSTVAVDIILNGCSSNHFCRNLVDRIRVLLGRDWDLSCF